MSAERVISGVLTKGARPETRRKGREVRVYVVRKHYVKLTGSVCTTDWDES